MVEIPMERVSEDVVMMKLTRSNVPGLVRGVLYTISVTACSEYTCRESDPVPIGEGGVYLPCSTRL